MSDVLICFCIICGVPLLFFIVFEIYNGCEYCWNCGHKPIRRASLSEYPMCNLCWENYVLEDQLDDLESRKEAIKDNKRLKKKLKDKL